MNPNDNEGAPNNNDDETNTLTHTTSSEPGIDTLATTSSQGDAEDTWSDEASGPLDGEFGLLLTTLEEDSVPLVDKVEVVIDKQSEKRALASPRSGESLYGEPISVEEAKKRVPPGDTGLLWQATIVPDQFFVNGKLRSDLHKRDYDVEQQTIKPRRATLPVTHHSFFSSLTKVDRPGGGDRYIFSGVLNGWPSLRYLELLKIEKRRRIAGMNVPQDVIKGEFLWSQVWDTTVEGRDGVEPQTVTKPDRIYRVHLRGAPWTAHGWSQESPGFVFWFEAQHPEGPRLVYGIDMVHTVQDCKCTAVHMISHRYANKRETARDRLTYHSLVLLEWDHRDYCTVVESAYLNGIGGYKGRCNWFHDKNEPITELYRALPPEMICPWLTTQAELRCYDVEAKSLEEFKAYISKYEGREGRFMDPRYTFSHRARLTFRSKPQIARYLVNYIGRDCGYSEIKRNCQTFGADLCSFLAGKKDVVPFHPVNRIEYYNRSHLFLYDSFMFDKKTKKVSRSLKK